MLTSFESPWQNGVAERWVGSCRRDLPDHVIAPEAPAFRVCLLPSRGPHASWTRKGNAGVPNWVRNLWAGACLGPPGRIAPPLRSGGLVRRRFHPSLIYRYVNIQVCALSMCQPHKRPVAGLRACVLYRLCCPKGLPNECVKRGSHDSRIVIQHDLDRHVLEHRFHATLVQK